MPKLHQIKPGGVAIYCDPILGETEVHCSTCAHCQRHTEFPSIRTMHQHVDVCRGCMRLICLECAGKPCRPWEKELERQEAEYRLMRKIEGAGWR
jgi:hypothetical protein